MGGMIGSGGHKKGVHVAELEGAMPVGVTRGASGTIKGSEGCVLGEDLFPVICNVLVEAMREGVPNGHVDWHLSRRKHEPCDTPAKEGTHLVHRSRANGGSLRQSQQKEW